MAGKSGNSSSHEVKEVVEVEQTSQQSLAVDRKKSTWQMAIQYKSAVLWSAFMGLGAINWGLDVLVSADKTLSARPRLIASAAFERRDLCTFLPERLWVSLPR